MILIDTDIFVIDRRYPRDPKFQVNRKFLDYLRDKEIERATTIFNLYELCGIMSFNLSKQQVQNLFMGFGSIYGLKIIYPPLGNKTAEEAFDRLLGVWPKTPIFQKWLSVSHCFFVKDFYKNGPFGNTPSRYLAHYLGESGFSGCFSHFNCRVGPRC